MANKSALDTFSDFAIISVTETGANTLTFKKLETGVSINDKVGWVLERAEYLPPAPDASVFNGTGDSLYYGISLSNSWATASLSEITIVDYNSITRLDYGTAAAEQNFARPIIKDFTNLLGGGLLLPPNPLYLYVAGSGLASATTVAVRLWYHIVPLAGDDFWNLVTARRPLSS